MGQMAFEKKFYTEGYSRHKGQMGQDGFYVGVDTTRPDEPMGHIAFGKNFRQRCTECIRDRWGQDRFYVGVDTRGPDEPMGQMAFEKKSTQKCTEWFLGQSLSCVCKRKKNKK